jgi:hypothetical protein
VEPLVVGDCAVRVTLGSRRGDFGPRPVTPSTDGRFPA